MGEGADMYVTVHMEFVCVCVVFCSLCRSCVCAVIHHIALLVTCIVPHLDRKYFTSRQCLLPPSLYEPSKVRVDHAGLGVVLGENLLKIRSSESVRLAEGLD